MGSCRIVCFWYIGGRAVADLRRNGGSGTIRYIAHHAHVLTQGVHGQISCTHVAEGVARWLYLVVTFIVPMRCRGRENSFLFVFSQCGPQAKLPTLLRQTLEQVPRYGFEWQAGRPSDWQHPWDDWIPTRYEQKALREGRTPHYLTFRRNGAHIRE